MTTDSARHLVVGRLRKPHGLKGECTVFPLTSDPEVVFAKGRSLWLMKLSGEVVHGPLVVDRSRAYHREWLVAFEGYSERGAVEGWNDLLLSAPAGSLKPPEDGEVYLHELAGFAVVDEQGAGLGVVSAVDETTTGVLLEVQGARREWILPFRKEFVRTVDRENRQLVVTLPDGLLE